MNNNHKKAVLSAALVAGVALGVGGTAAPALADTGSGVHAPTGAATTGAATTSATGEAATPQSAPGNTAPVTVSRISVATGSQAGGTRMTVQGSNLATDTSSGGEVTYSKPTVTFTIPAATRGGRAITATAAPESVTVVSPGTIRVVTPSIPLAGKATITVTNGSATSSTRQAPAFTFTPAVPFVADDGVSGHPTSDGGGAITITGSYLGDQATTRVLVGGKNAPVTAATGSSLTAQAPSGLKGVQDVVVISKGGTVDAGTLEYAAVIPTVLWPTTRASAEKGATFDVTGANLQYVTKGTIIGADRKPHNVTVKQANGADRGKKLTVTVPANLAVGEGTIVLNTPYTATASAAFTIEKAGKPTLAATNTHLGKAGGPLVLGGTNLRYIRSVQVGSTTLGRQGYTATPDGTQLTVTVPAQRNVPSIVPIVVTTDGGTVTYRLPVSDTSLTSAAYDAATKKITLTGTSLGSLTGITVKGPDGKPLSGVKFTAARDGRTSVSAAFTKAPANGAYTVSAKDASGLPFSTTFTVGNVVSTTLTRAEYAGGRLTLTGTGLDGLTQVTLAGPGEGGSPGQLRLVVAADRKSATVDQRLPAGSFTVAGKDQAGKTLSTTFDVVATTVTKAEYAGGVLTLTGDHLEKLSEVILTPYAEAAVSAPVTPVVAADGKSATIALPGLDAGHYGVDGKDQAGSRVGGVFDVVVTTVSTAEYAGGVLTLIGTGLGGLSQVTVTGSGENAAAAPVELTVAQDGKSATADLTGLPADTYTVGGKDQGGTAVDFPGFTVVATTVDQAAYAGGVLTLTGAGLDELTGVTVTGDAEDAAAVPVELQVTEDGKTGTVTIPLTADTYTLAGKDQGGNPVTKTFDVVATTVTKAEYTSGVLTLTGTGLGQLTDVKVTGDGANAQAQPVELTVASDGTSATARIELAAGSYTVAGKDQAGKTVDGGAFQVAAPAVATTVSKAAYAGGVLTLTGTGLDQLTDVKVTGDGADPVAVTLTPAQNGTSATATVDLAPGAYTVTGKDQGGNPVSKTFEVAGA